MYVYIKSQCHPDLWTVGFYQPDGKWVPESDHNEEQAAASRVMELNGGGRVDTSISQRIDAIQRRLDRLERSVNALPGILMANGIA